MQIWPSPAAHLPLGYINGLLQIFALMLDEHVASSAGNQFAAFPWESVENHLGSDSKTQHLCMDAKLDGCQCSTELRAESERSSALSVGTPGSAGCRTIPLSATSLCGCTASALAALR